MVLRTRYGQFRCALSVLCVLLFTSCAQFMVKNNFGNGPDSTRVRVLLLRAQAEFTVSSQAAFRISGKNDAEGKRSVVFRPDEIRSRIQVVPGSAPLMLNGNPYRGSLEIVPINGTIHVVNILRIDEYLSSVVPGEIPSGWEHDALKAQAVASRTYTCYHLINGRKERLPYDIDATAQSQVYRGIVDEKKSTTEAVLDTSGEILVHGGRPILSYFHSTCGGKTSDDKYVWNGSQMPYLNSVRCGFCQDSTKFRWETRLGLDEIRNHLSRQNPGIGSIRNVTFRRKNDRVTDVVIRHSKGVIAVSGNNFRLMFPTDKIMSLYFTSKKIENGLLLTGNGWGHGVGMCQWGARGMARKGFGYRDILKHYYTGITVTDMRSGYIASKIRNPFSFQ